MEDLSKSSSSDSSSSSRSRSRSNQKKEKKQQLKKKKFLEQFLLIHRQFQNKEQKVKSKGDNESRSSSNSSKSSKDSQKKKEKKQKKESSNKKDEKKSKKSKKEKKSKKDKTDKKSKKQKKDKKKKVKAKQYGHYGTINKGDYQEKREEFYLWLKEVKSVNYEIIQQKQEKELFEDFVEDYNMAILPDKKYYNIKLWEQKQKNNNPGAVYSSVKDESEYIGNDEEQLRQQKLKQKEVKNYLQTKAAVNQLLINKEMVQDLQKESNLKFQMNQSFKSGDTSRAQEIHSKLYKKKDQNED